MLLIWTSQGIAADWYVSLATGNNKNAGTKEAPFKNIWKAIASAASQPGIIQARCPAAGSTWINR